MAKDKITNEDIVENETFEKQKLQENKKELEKENQELKNSNKQLLNKIKELNAKIESGKLDDVVHVEGKQYKIKHKGNTTEFFQDLKMRNIPDNHLCVSLELVK